MFFSSICVVVSYSVLVIAVMDNYDEYIDINSGAGQDLANIERK